MIASVLYVDVHCNQQLCFFFFFNDTATTEIYTLSLHDALPISRTDLYPRQIRPHSLVLPPTGSAKGAPMTMSSTPSRLTDRKSTRLNSSHANISYAVFCLKKKKTSVHYIALLPYIPPSHLNHSI